MRLARRALFPLVLAMTAGVGAPALAAPTCQGFMDAFAKAAPDLKSQFVRPVVVSRGAAEAGAEARDLVTEFGVDARLLCNGDRFLRFEAQIPQPAQQRVVDGFNRIQVAAAMAALRWQRQRASQTISAMAVDAAEYLRASAERGDVFISGKVDRIVGRDGEIALVWTQADRSFIVVGPVP
jgi:hypothetical protein